MSDPDLRLRDAYPYNDSFNAMEVATADRRFEQLVERREKLIERSRFGVLALNGASTIGVLSNYEGLRSELGVDPRIALTFFTTGMILSVVSIFFETNFLASRAAQAFGHLSSLRAMRATLDDRLTEVTEKRLGQQLNEMKARSARGSVTKIELEVEKTGLPNDFAYSPAALIALNFGAGAWTGGVVTMMAALFA